MGRSRSRSRERSRGHERAGGRSRSREGRSRHKSSPKGRSRSRESSRRREHHHHHSHTEEKRQHDRHGDGERRRDRSRDRPSSKSSRGEERDVSRSRQREKDERRRDKDDERRDKGERRRDDERRERRSNGVDKSTGAEEEARQQQKAAEAGGGRAAEDGDDESPVLMMAVSEEDEEREMAERKRKRQEVLEQHKRKLQEEKRQLAACLDGKTQAEAELLEEEERARRKRKAEGVTATEQAAGSDEEEEEEEDETVVVTTQHKVMSDEEAEDEDEERRRGTGGEEEAAPALDMFSFSPTKGGVLLKPGQGYIEAAGLKAATGEGADHVEDWDDPEGYYKTMAGEVLADRYVVMGAIGRGVFSTVLKCKDKKTQNEDGSLVHVAIKMVRNNDVMRKAAQRELDLLREISETDPENKKHCVRLLGHFEHRSHVAMVFESLQMNLRETLRKFGKHVGINIGAVRTYGKQLLVALKHIGNLNIVHADIKPDNILVNEGFSQLKLCDFGSGFKEDAADNAPTPYLVSRFYRAPEVILYGDYTKAVDLWSIGCCLYELFTGRVAFPGANNNEMVRLMMELKGPVPIKNIRKHRQAYVTLGTEPLFEDDGRFRQRELDPVTKNPSVRLVHFTKPTRDLTSILLKAKTASDDRQMVLNLANLLDKIFTLDPTKRLTVREALHHPFISSGKTV